VSKLHYFAVNEHTKYNPFDVSTTTINTK